MHLQDLPIVEGLTSLPPELLELIYHHLDSIDDVHSLGRAHSRILHVIEHRTVYTEIMRSIIGRSWVHRYDLQLCNILKLHEEIVQHFQDSGLSFPVFTDQHGQGYNPWEESLPSTTVIPECAFGPCAVCIPDIVVYDILARYQGLRVIEDMWLTRQLEQPDLLAADAAMEMDDDEFIRLYTSLLGRSQDFEDGDLAARSKVDCATHDHTKLNPDQRGRFYSAVTFVWILNELRWVLTNFSYPSRDYHHIQVLDKCRADLRGLCQNFVLDQLDQHAVFFFMYHHLLPLHSPALQDRDSSKLPFTFSTKSHANGMQSSRTLRFFLTAGQTYFQPPDLIDLAVRHKISRSHPYPEMVLPATTEEWIRPAKTFLFPANIALGDDGSRMAQLFDTHVAIINHSSFAQTMDNSLNPAVRRALPTSFMIIDHARCYFRDAAVAAIEQDEGFRDDLRPARVLFDGEWQTRGLWRVWWWANSEDKARAIITRWREKHKSARDQRVSQPPLIARTPRVSR